MSFGRWLLVHSFSLFMLALLILLYLFRSELQLDKAYRQLISLPPIEQVAKKPATTVDKQEPGKQDTTDDIRPSQTNTPVDDSTNRSAPPQELVAIPTLSESRPEETNQTGDLIRARKAYWNNDYARAIDEYKRLIRQHPDNPDYLGELGNIYYTLNDDQHAAKLYYQAAMIFLQQNKRQRARSLIAPITAMNRELGERLQRQLKR